MLGKGALTCIASACGSGDRAALERGTMQALLTAVIIAVPAAAGLFVLAPEVLSFLYPRQTDEAALCVAPLRYLMAGMVCLCASYPLFSMLQAAGKPSAPLKIMLAGTGLKLAGNLLLIPLMGVDGAALSTTLCYVLILCEDIYYRTENKNTNYTVCKCSLCRLDVRRHSLSDSLCRETSGTVAIDGNRRICGWGRSCLRGTSEVPFGRSDDLFQAHLVELCGQNVKNCYFCRKMSKILPLIVIIHEFLY